MNQHSSNFHTDAAAIKSALINQLPRLVNNLFPNRMIHRVAHEYRIGTHGSLSVRCTDGSYFDHEAGAGGDIITLIQHTLMTDFKGALVWARGFLGQHHTKPVFIATPAPSQPNPDVYNVRQRDKALAMLKRSTPIHNTLAEVYLREKRGISIEQFPVSLRFLTHAYNYTANGYYPTMIAEMCDVNGKPSAAHCTFLNPATGDKLQGDGIKSRLIFGSCRGGAIRLSQATERLALCEGIEDGLSILQCAPDWPVWVTGGTSGLRALQIPSYAHELMICADRDEAGLKAANDLSARLAPQGKKVRIALPPEGVKDFNDLLRHGGTHA